MLKPAMTDAPPAEIKLSVVIRCRNEADRLRDTLEALRAQRCDFSREVLVVDNESEDDTRAVCEELGARVVTICKADFTYGRALNLGISHARGELILLLSAHSLPIGSHFLASAVEPFADPQMAAARCLMVGSNRQIAEWHRPRDIQYRTPEEQHLAQSGPQWDIEYPAAGCCALRRSVWDEVKFDETLEANEDKLWASQVLARGFKIRRCAEALWLYTRKHTKREALRKRTREHLGFYRFTGVAPMSWSQCIWLSLRVLFVAPYVAARHVVDNINWYVRLASIPLRARRSPEPGRKPEFDLPRRGSAAALAGDTRKSG